MKLDEATVLRCPKYKQGILHLKGLSLININIIPDVINASDLVEINIENNLIKELGEVSKYCWGIKKLSAGTNFLSLFSEIGALSEIEYLDISTNRFTEIGSMAHMKNLKYLSIEHNEISQISDLPQNLEIFKAGWNNLHNLNFLTCQKLVELHISNNKIRHLSRLTEKCKNMKVLDMSYNMISKDEHRVLQVLLKNELSKVNVISFEGNEISAIDNFVLEVLKYVQPDRVNSNLITPFLKSTFRNLGRNNLDDFLSMVETDYAVNIKKQYQQKSNIIRGLNQKQGGGVVFDDFKHLNKEKVVKFVQEMQKGNRKKDNQMMNLYRQMKMRNKEQQDIEREIRMEEDQKRERREQQRREKQRERQREMERQRERERQRQKQPLSSQLTSNSQLSDSPPKSESTVSQTSTFKQSDLSSQSYVPTTNSPHARVLKNIYDKNKKNQQPPPKPNKQPELKRAQRPSKKKENLPSKTSNKVERTIKTVRTVDPESEQPSESYDDDGISSSHPSDLEQQSDDDMDIYDDKIWRNLRRHYMYY